MALRLAEAGKDTARAVLEAAYESLERSSRVGQGKSTSIYEIAPIAAALLPVAERIDPKLVDEYLWRSLAMRPPKPWDAGPIDRSPYVDVLLAMFLARYDRAIARSLVEPLVPERGSASRFISNRSELHAAAAAIDPKWAVAIVESMPEDGDVKLQSSKNAARLAVANVLGRAGEQRFRKLETSFLNVWVPDIEDIDPYD
jgi:hypothetical protein